MDASALSGSAKGEDDGWCVLSDPEIAPVTVLDDHWDSESEADKDKEPEVDEAEWRASLAVGQLLDALDTDNKWYESRVVDAEEGRVKVHYRGWTSKWDEWLPRDSSRLMPLHSRVRNWRNFAVNDEVQVGFSVPLKSYPEWWNARVLAVERDSGTGVTARIQVKVDARRELWMDAQDEMLCAPRTHPSRNATPPPVVSDLSSTNSESAKSADNGLTSCQRAAQVVQSSYGTQWDPKDVVEAINVVMDQATAEIFLVMAPGKHRDMWLRTWIDKKRSSAMP